MTFYISVSGSLMSREEGLDAKWVRDFSEEVEASVKDGNSFCIVVGGGKICSQYVNLAKELNLGNDFADDVGIDVTKLNAKILRGFLKNEDVELHHGTKVGQTTDMALLDIVVDRNVKEIINLTRVNGIYDKDPKGFPNAELIREINASEYLEMFKAQKMHTPKSVAPFEYNAAKKALESGIQVYVMNGLSPHKEFHDFLGGKKNSGTRIIPK